MAENFDEELQQLENANSVYIQEEDNANTADEVVKASEGLSQDEIKARIAAAIKHKRAERIAKKKAEQSTQQLANETSGASAASTVSEVSASEASGGERSIKDLTPEELEIYRDGIAAFKDFVEYAEEIKKRNRKYDALQTTMFICNAHRAITQKYSHVVEIMCNEGQFNPKFFFDYLIMMRNNEKKDKAVRDTIYDMLYIVDLNKNLTGKQKREIFQRFVDNYREQDRKKAEVVDEATREAKLIKEKNKEIYINIIKSKIDTLRAVVKKENVAGSSSGSAGSSS